jgi:hypothetical protein
MDYQDDINELANQTQSAANAMANSGKIVASEYYSSQGIDASAAQETLLGQSYT